MAEAEHLVAREAELARLGDMLDLAIGGKGQVCFVAGAAGTGKTALSEAFQRIAQAGHPELVIAGGGCDAQVGGASAYAPFHEVLGALTAGAASRAIAPSAKSENGARVLRGARLVLEALAKFGPDLVQVFIPGTPFLGKIADFVIDQAGLRDKFKKKIGAKQSDRGLLTAGSLSQDQVIEQFVNVLRELATKMPLLVVLDNVHWADEASIDLISRLCRRVSDARILLICTLRIQDLRVGRIEDAHPMEKVINEARRLLGDVVLDLTVVSETRGREFVHALIDSEPNHLDARFRDNLYAHTEGQPLFTVELMHDFRSRGILVQDEKKAWILAAPVDWAAIPARVEGVVAGRLSGLPKEMRDLLNVAAAEGQEFTAELIAKVESRDARDVVRSLSGALQDAFQLVCGLDTRRIGAQRLSRYRFSHQLFQKYLYNDLDDVERSYLHEAIGYALEGLYGAQADEFAPRLASHFERAGLPDKARPYLTRAGEQAAAVYANSAALDFFDRALALTPSADGAARIALLLLRERVYNVVGQRDRQRADLDVLQALTAGSSDRLLRADLLLRRARLALDVSDYGSALDTAMAADAMIGPEASTAGRAQQVEAFLIRARAYFFRSETDACGKALESALALCRQAGLVSPQARILEQQGTLSWSVGDYSIAREKLEAALALARENNDLRTEWSVLNNSGVVATEARAFVRAAKLFAEARAIVARIGHRAAEARLLINEGDAGYEAGDFVLARDCARQAFAIAVDIAERQIQAITSGNLGETLIEVGDYAPARQQVDGALALALEIGFRRGECACREWLSRIHLACGEPDAAVAQAEAGVALAGELKTRARLGSLRICQARALSALGRHTESLAAGEAARSLSTELGSPALAVQADAARIEALLAREGPGDIALALRLSLPEVEILGHSDQRGAPLEYPLWTSLAMIRAMIAGGDPRALDAAVAAVDALKSRAARIADPAMRRGFVDNVPEHAALQRLYAELKAKSAQPRS